MLPFRSVSMSVQLLNEHSSIPLATIKLCGCAYLLAKLALAIQYDGPTIGAQLAMANVTVVVADKQANDLLQLSVITNVIHYVL